MTLSNFIVFEGLDGSGTSTQIQLLTKKIQSNRLFVTTEPTNLPTGKFIRKILKGEFSIDEKTIAYLFAADRCEHIYGKNGIIENLQNGKLVVSDRYFFSSIAYQSIMAGDDLPKKLNENFPLPEFLFFFKISSDKAFKRVSKRGEEKEIYEKIDFQKKVEQNYEKIINSYKNDTNTSNKKIENTNEKNATSMKIITLDANLPVEEVSKIIWTHLKNLPILNM